MAEEICHHYVTNLTNVTIVTSEANENATASLWRVNEENDKDEKEQDGEDLLNDNNERLIDTTQRSGGDGNSGGHDDTSAEDVAFTEFDEVPPVLRRVNQYQYRKNLAQGMMDLALFSANANQLRSVLENRDRHPYYYLSLVLISLSLFFQIAVGIGLTWNASYDVEVEGEVRMANKSNNFTVVIIFLVTAINVFISVFGAINDSIR